jgi:hypothetical protein
VRPLRRRNSPVVPFFFLTWLLGALWALATPVMGVPDEPAHVIRAASVARGQVLPTSTAEKNGERVDFARVPRTLAWPERPCYAQHEDETPACDVAPRGRGDDLVEVESRLQRNDPVYYAFVGLPTLVAPGETTIYVMRLVTAAFVAAFFALAAIALVECATPRWALVGLAAALTPMVLFLAGSVNPNAVEIAAGLALWATFLSWFSRPDRSIDRSRAVRAAIAGGVLGVSRPLSPVFLLLIVAGSLLVLEPGALREVWRAGRIAGCLVAGLSIAGLAWTLAVGTIATGSTVDFPEYESVRRYVYSVLISLNDYERQMIGVFGWLDTQAGAHVSTLWLAILGFLVVAAFGVGGTVSVCFSSG